MKKPFAAIGNDPPGKRRMRSSAIVPLCIAVAVILSLAAYAGSVIFIKRFGVRLMPSKDHAVIVQRFDRQNDPRWSGDAIGASDRQMGGTGCLVTSVATAIANLGVPMEPKELNRLLTRIGGYQGADLLWYKIHEAVPTVDYHYQRIFTSRTIERDLEAGLMPIVNVKFYKTGYTHWVLIAGAHGGDFLILDPLGDGRTPTRLSEHGNVYAYRVIRKAS